MSTSESTPIACVLDAIPDENRERHEWLGRQFQAAIDNVEELVDGYKFTLHKRQDVLMNTAEWITWERLCCPFFHFTIEVENEQVWLSLTGKDNVKEFITAQLLESLDTNSG